MSMLFLFQQTQLRPLSLSLLTALGRAHYLCFHTSAAPFLDSHLHPQTQMQGTSLLEHSPCCRQGSLSQQVPTEQSDPI